MPHAIWNGSISFGLVTIPVTIFPAEDRSTQLSFHMLDKRDLSPIRQKRVNESTGEEVAWDDIVKGYKLDDGRWVVLSDTDFQAANVEATQTIDILAAVCADQIAPEYFDAPYYLQPGKPGRKAYALLRETLKRTERVALAKVIIRTRQHLAALVPEGDALLLEILRYPYELRSTADLELPGSDLGESGVTDAELKMAGELVAAISRDFDATDPQYADTYHDDLLALIEKKAAGESVEIPEREAAPAGEVVDIVALLKRSIEDAKQAQG